MRKGLSAIIIFGLGLLPIGLAARHIIGGVMTYECLGQGSYEFTLKVYRDCNCTNCANFDNVARIAVYNCDGDCAGESQARPFAIANPPIMQVRSVEEPSYPCLIPPDVCVEEGIYRWRMTLPVSSKSYHISYQRCCRNVTINNIINPESAGATYTIEITPAAQAICNSSPVFSNFPPTIICNNADLEFDHSATDKDGNQLVYEFCSPLLGGGNQLGPALVETCGGANPNPSCPPPFSVVPFSAPQFTFAEPMGGDPVISINPATGVITGKPNLLGQYVVGVCVKEYDSQGVLLSKVFRDFQFNVANCDPQVYADIKEDVVIGDKAYLINACGEFTITLQNESYQQQFIKTWEWIFDIKGKQQKIADWNPTVTFPGIGSYEGKLYLNPGTECADTGNIFINVFPDITADFSFAYDTCIAGPVAFNDLSRTGADKLVSWEWSMGDGGVSKVQNPRYTYGKPGNMAVTLKVTDNNQCKDQITKSINYFPVPALIVIAPSAFTGCVPANIFFNNLSTPIDETYKINWDFGDGGSSTEISPTHIYDQPGTFSVGVDITSPIGCKTDTFFRNLIKVLPSPVADFSFFPEKPSNLTPVVEFMDASSGAIQWLWDFGNGARSIERNPSYVYQDTGYYQVMQIVTHPSGCKDTLIKDLDVAPEIRYYLPNAFTPNEDSVNDIFNGKGILLSVENFSMSIWNRWGELVFQTDNPDEGWNGRKNNSGELAPNGVYPVVVRFLGPRRVPFEFKGFATLVR